MYFAEDYSFSLVNKLLFADKEITVHTYKEYPQFEITEHPLFGIHASFDKSGTGYISKDDSTIIVRNLSTKRSIKITSITCDGIDLDFDLSGGTLIKSGESASFKLAGSIPAGTMKHAEVTVEYSTLGTLSPAGERTFDVATVG